MQLYNKTSRGGPADGDVLGRRCATDSSQRHGRSGATRRLRTRRSRESMRAARGLEQFYGVFAAGAAGAAAGVSTFALMFTLWSRPPTMPRPNTNHATMASKTMTTIAHAAPEPP